jgi:vacuolar protein sorting-associated protein 72
MRNLLILSSFPNLDAPPTSSRARTVASQLKDKDRAALVQLCRTLFHWSEPDAALFVSNMLAAQAAKTQKAREAHDAAIKPVKPLCAVTNAVARYRDPETGIAYRDARAFGVLRGVVGGGFVWSGDLGCYVGGRAKPLESMGGKGFLGMPPAAGVPRRFLEMSKKPPHQAPAPAPASKVAPATPTTPLPDRTTAAPAVKTETPAPAAAPAA